MRNKSHYTQQLLHKISPSQWRHNEHDGVTYHDVSIVCSTVCSGADQRTHQSSASLAFVRAIHWWLVDFPRNEAVTRKCFHLVTSSYPHRNKTRQNRGRMLWDMLYFSRMIYPVLIRTCGYLNDIFITCCIGKMTRSSAARDKFQLSIVLRDFFIHIPKIYFSFCHIFFNSFIIRFTASFQSNSFSVFLFVYI